MVGQEKKKTYFGKKKINNNKLLYTSTGLILAPCSYCNRKPSYFEKNINYCWVHWDKKNKSNVKIQIKK
jgi:hypothetical protein